MWTQSYTPVAGSLGWSSVAAALPIFTLLYLLGVKRRPAWVAGLAGLGVAMCVALFVYRTPPAVAASSAALGVAFGLLPVGWLLFGAIVLYRMTVETGQFEIVKDSIGRLTADRRLQALLIAFAFGAFIEGAAGSGTPVAVAGAMLAGLGFSPFYAAAICLVANTAPVAFGAIGTPVITLAVTTGLPLDRVSAAVGRLCAPISLAVPAYLVGLMYGWKGLRSVAPAVVVCGVSFAVVQFLASNLLGPQLTDILSSIASMGALVLLFRVWTPADTSLYQGGSEARPMGVSYSGAAQLRAWGAYILLALCVLLWGFAPVRKVLDSVTIMIEWPGLHDVVQRVAPVVPAAAPYPALFKFDWLAAAGSSCVVASILSLAFIGMTPRRYARLFLETLYQMRFPVLTITSVVGLAFLMNYSGATATLGLAFGATGLLFPYFSAMLGWLGVFLTGSDASSNALFGNLQVVAANSLKLNPMLTAAANSAGGVMGKMISLQSIAVGVAATGLPVSDESRLFRFTLRHSVLLASLIGLLATFYAYVAPSWIPAAR